MSVTTEHLPGAVITTGPQSWQVLQREADGRAPVTLEGTWAGDGPSTVEVRVARENDGSPASGCDWQSAEMLPENQWRITLRVPTGGLYRIETRVYLHGVEWRNTGDKIWHVSVGDLWVITGQSNAAGYGHGPVVDPPSLGVSLFGGNEVWRMATHPIFDPTGTKHPANRDSGWVDVSPWLAFAKTIFEQAGVPIGLIPTALGGSPLCAWDPGNPDGAYLYDNMVSMIEAAGGRVAGMVWYQGCSDANDEWAATYLARFTRFIETFRAHFGATLPVITAQLNKVYFSAPESMRPWSMIREVQRQAAQVIPQLAVVPTLDLTLSDVVHTSGAGNVVLGQRFGRVALSMVYGQDTPWQAVDLHEARFTDNERTWIRLYFDHVVDHLITMSAQEFDFQVEDEDGWVTVTSAQVEEDSRIVLGLERPAQGRTVCHHMYGCNPICMTLDHFHQPVLAFSGVEVAAAE